MLAGNVDVCFNKILLIILPYAMKYRRNRQLISKILRFCDVGLVLFILKIQRGKKLDVGNPATRKEARRY